MPGPTDVVALTDVLSADTVGMVSTYLQLKDVGSLVVAIVANEGYASSIKACYLKCNFHFIHHVHEQNYLKERDWAKIRRCLEAWLEVNADWKEMYKYEFKPSKKLTLAERSAFHCLFDDLVLALWVGIPDIVRHLVGVRCADVNQRWSRCPITHKFTSPLEVAMRHNMPNSDGEDTMEFIVNQEGINVNVRAAENDSTVLHVAAYSEDISIRKFNMLLAHPQIDVNAADSDGDTSLHYVCILMPTNAVTRATMLLDAGANINLRNNFNRTPLMCLLESKKCHPEKDQIIQLLSSTTIRPNKIHKGETVVNTISTSVATALISTGHTGTSDFGNCS